MYSFKHLSLAFLAIVALVHGQDQRGFISIDCGADSSSTYTDTQLNYVADVGFTDTGTMMNVSSEYMGDDLPKELWTLRSFPQGVRNCYHAEVESDIKYLIRATFLYSNYDGKNSTPQFDLYFGPNFWFTMAFEAVDNIYHKEIIHITTSNQVEICLVNTGNGIPFISTLELRPLKTDIYKPQIGSLATFLRLDIGSKDNMFYRYPDDIYDRIWSPPVPISKWTAISTENQVNNQDERGFLIPSVVLSTACTVINTSEPMSFFWTSFDQLDEFYIYIFFAEVEKLQANQTRLFKIYLNDELWLSQNLDLPYLKVNLAYVTQPLSKNRNSSSEGEIDYSFKLVMSEGSTLPPIVNAIEIFKVINFTQSPTDQEDVDAIKNIKLIYGVKRLSWQGDPCAPKEFVWQGLGCNYDGLKPPRITTLNLSSTGLTGEIPVNISNLKRLEILDLSNNNLNGSVPEFLAQMSMLKILNLQGNNLSGQIPVALIERQNNGLLSFSWEQNPNLHATEPSERKNNIVIPIVAGVIGGAIVLSIGIFAIAVFIRRKRRTKQGSQDFETPELRGQQYSYSDILTITNNFKRLLGEGGFGKVFYGIINNVEVAVKMLSPTSAQGYQQFQAEVDLLLRVHHKNLIGLVGYCKDGTNLGLIYEYMGKGNLGSLLLDGGEQILSWKERLRIALDAAQGLEYLHNGCRPPMIHRDIKTDNILLNNDFQAKLADFGLSKTFPTDGGTTHVTTNVVGTPGYLDPEYYRTYRLTEKSDVYSFGVVLLEIITGRPVLTRAEERSHIIEWVDYLINEGDIDSIIDPNLRDDYDSNSAWKMVDIAMSCVSKSLGTRPSMIQIVNELRECQNFESNQITIEPEFNAETPISKGLDFPASFIPRPR